MAFSFGASSSQPSTGFGSTSAPGKNNRSFFIQSKNFRLDFIYWAVAILMFYYL